MSLRRPLPFEVTPLEPLDSGRPIYCTSGRRAGPHNPERYRARCPDEAEARWLAVEGEHAWHLCDRCLPIVTGHDPSTIRTIRRGPGPRILV